MSKEPTGNITIGNNNTCMHSNCIVIGEGITTSKDSEMIIKVGSDMIRAEIDDDLRAKFREAVVGAGIWEAMPVVGTENKV